MLGRAGRTGGVAGGADFLVDLLAGLEDARRVRVLDFQGGDGLDAMVDGFGRLGGAGALVGTVTNKTDQQDDHDNRHQEGGDHDSDQLFRGLDGRLVVVVFLVDVTHTELSILQGNLVQRVGGGLLCWPLSGMGLFLPFGYLRPGHVSCPGYVSFRRK
ncbi:hypothetical protein D3C86_1604240 [compost metagenome]